MYALKRDKIDWTHLPPSSLLGTAELRSEDGHHVTVPVATLVSSPLIRSIMSGLHQCCTPFVLYCPVDAEVLHVAGEIFTEGAVMMHDEDDQTLHEARQLLEMMKVPAKLAICFPFDQESLESGIKVEIKEESQYHSEDDFGNQNQESSDPWILPESESVMDSLQSAEMTLTHEEDEHIAHEVKDCRAALNAKTAKYPDCSLNQHDRTQREERELMCPNCDYATTRYCNLERHIRMHAAEEKKHRIHGKENHEFQCQDCGYSTNYKSVMKNHVMIHTGEKLYSCPYCEYSTIQSCNMKRHVRRNHN